MKVYIIHGRIEEYLLILGSVTEKADLKFKILNKITNLPRSRLVNLKILNLNLATNP
jgi:hypothetical protein